MNDKQRGLEEKSQREILTKEIDLIQSCINRMAQNSFVVKGWTVTLIAVVMALRPQLTNFIILGTVGIAITVCFWYLDAYYLWMERLYRWKYEWVISNRMLSDQYCYDLNPHNVDMYGVDESGKKREKGTAWKTMCRPILLVIYCPLLVVSIIGLIYGIAVAVCC